MEHADEVISTAHTFLAEGWYVQKEGCDTRAFNILDTYGGAILTSGRVLLEFPEKPVKLELLPDMLEEQMDEPLSAATVDPASLNVGRLREIVVRSMGEWRLGIRAWGVETVDRYRIENDDRKGVARLLLCSFRCEGGETVNAVEVHPYRGYEQEVSSIRKRLEALYPLSAVLPVLFQSLPYTVHGLAEPLPSVWSRKNARAAVVDLGKYILNRIRHYEPGVIEDHDPEVLHQYRVALRRIRSLLTLLGKAFLGTERETLRDELKLAMRGTNRLRDLDIQIVEVAGLRSAIPDILQPGLDRLLVRLNEERELEFESVRKALTAVPFDKRFAGVASIFDSQAEPDPETISNLIGPAIVKRYRRIAREIGVLEGETKPELLHGVRVSCKNLRYLLEFFPGLLRPDPAQAFIKDLKRLQTLLGGYNDLCVLEAFLLKQAKGHSTDSAVLMTVGAIVMQLRRKRNRIVKQGLAAAHNFCSREHRKSVRNVLKGEEG